MQTDKRTRIKCCCDCDEDAVVRIRQTGGRWAPVCQRHYEIVEALMEKKIDDLARGLED